MPNFSNLSKERLQAAHIDLQTLFNEVIKKFDCIVLQSYRDKAAQDAAFEKGNSKLKWPLSKHNTVPALAVDVAPYSITPKGVDWKDVSRFYLFAGFVLGTANQLHEQRKMEHSIRWGGNWSVDVNIKPGSFVDLSHFELA